MQSGLVFLTHGVNNSVQLVIELVSHFLSCLAMLRAMTLFFRKNCLTSLLSQHYYLCYQCHINFHSSP